jgi:hypothetical protein
VVNRAHDDTEGHRVVGKAADDDTEGHRVVNRAADDDSKDGDDTQGHMPR